ncbi:hypothetical protein SESBI_07633 [Sesbania bispinosa]|nr:hypothetical protein SESBI_07633 [Sesbania bispinosa]
MEMMEEKDQYNHALMTWRGILDNNKGAMEKVEATRAYDCGTRVMFWTLMRKVATC